MKYTVNAREYCVTFEDGEYLSLLWTGEHPVYKTGTWKVWEQGGFVLDDRKGFIREPFPSNRTDEHIQATRFPYEKALALLVQHKHKELAKT